MLRLKKISKLYLQPQDVNSLLNVLEQLQTVKKLETYHILWAHCGQKLLKDTGSSQNLVALGHQTSGKLVIMNTATSHESEYIFIPAKRIELLCKGTTYIF